MRTFGIMLRALGIVAAVEILVMYFLEFWGLPDGLEKSLLDALLLVSLSGPVLYFWVIRVMAQRLSEHHFQEMVQGVRAVVWEAEAAPLALTFVNRHIEDLLGYPASQCLTEKNFWARHVHPEDQESVLNALSGAIVHGKGCESRYRLVAADGRLVWVRDQVTPFTGTGGQRCLRGVMIDITEHRRAEETVQESESHLRDFLDNVSDLIQSVSPEGRFRFVNRAWRESLGYREDEIPQLSLFDTIHPDQRQHFLTLRQRLLQGEPLQNVETVFVAKDGRNLTVSGNINCRFEHGKPVATRGIFRDVTDQRKAQKELGDNNRLLTRLVWELERRNKETTLLNEMADLLIAPLSSVEAYGIITQYGQRLFPVEAGALFVYRSSRNVLEQVAAWGELWAKEKWFGPDQCWALRRGKLHSVKDPSAGLLCAHVGTAAAAGYVCFPMMAQGETLGLFHLEMAPVHSPETEASERGLTEDKQRLALSFAEHIALALANLDLRETLRNQSIRDPLTGLYNRRYMEESLQREMFRASRKQRPVGAILIDLDHFKRTNDMFGHEAGDTLLREVGNLLQQQARKEDIVCRYGGEEFLLILPETTLDVLQKRAEHLRTAIKALHVSHHGQPLNALTMSVGVAAFPDHGLSAESLLQAADSAMYRAKQEGRDRVVVANVVLAEDLPVTPSIGPADSRIVLGTTRNSSSEPSSRR